MKSRTMTLESWQRDGRTFDFRDRRIFYRDSDSSTSGEEPTLLLIHGFPTASWDWHRIWPALSSRYRVVAADMLGFGFSDKPRGHDYSIFEQADLQEELLERLGIEAVHVVAHDYGDTVTQELLARRLERPDRTPRIRSVCLLNGGLFPEAIRRRPIQRLLESPLGFLVGPLMWKGRFRRSISAIFGPGSRPDDAMIDAFWGLVIRDGGRRVVHRIARYQRERHEYRDRWVGALQRTDVIPIRLVVGPADPVSGLEMARRYRELVPDADVVVLDEVIGHYPQLEAPASVLKHLPDAE